jgi:uncharacterized protein with PIN domain
MTNLNTQPVKFDYGRTRYLPEHIFDCGQCQTPLESFRDATVLPGNFHHPGMNALLCERCAKLFWDAEVEGERMAREAGY